MSIVPSMWHGEIMFENDKATAAECSEENKQTKRYVWLTIGKIELD